MTVAKPTSSRKSRETPAVRKSFPLQIPNKGATVTHPSGRRMTVDALDVKFDCPPIARTQLVSSSSSAGLASPGREPDDLQQLLAAIHQRYKSNAEHQERAFKDTIKQTVKRSVGEFHGHMERFSQAMEGRLGTLRQDLNTIYLERQKQLDRIYEQYDEFKLSMQESIQRVEERDTGFRNAVAQYFDDTKTISTLGDLCVEQEYRLDLKAIEDLVERATVAADRLKQR